MNDQLPYTGPQAGKRLPRLLALAVVMGVIAAGLVAAAWFLKKDGPSAGTQMAIPSNARMIAAVGSTPFAPAYAPGADAWERIPLPGEPEAVVVSAVDGQEGTYYLAVPAGEGITQLYLLRRGASVAERLTTSETFKYRLSADLVTGDIGYMSIPSRNPLPTEETALVRFRDGREESVALARLGVMLPNGQGALLARSDGFYLAAGDGQEPRKILDTPIDQPFALSADGTRFAYFNVRTGAVDEFDASAGLAGMSYLRSVPVQGAPEALAYWGTDLISAAADPNAGTLTVENHANGLVSGLPLGEDTLQKRVWSLSLLPNTL